MGKELLTGEHFIHGDAACAEGGIAAGCRFFAGYPITPATEVAERMARAILPHELETPPPLPRVGPRRVPCRRCVRPARRWLAPTSPKQRPAPRRGGHRSDRRSDDRGVIGFRAKLYRGRPRRDDRSWLEGSGRCHRESNSAADAAGLELHDYRSAGANQ